ncbi:WecB/TagA/CpsF family glycosyltransferase [Sinimarinibacterium flocculans]|uniref:WecB/TagA/CpsF family glycosyltransferase n=1 Tax=Sinimarinibacterium flocculans TaxID=985250 RepID=UPI002491E5E1|nr:WecB/TagA/CpsF family glycosyltransferase [Sinimarinibacterium flocculans]
MPLFPASSRTPSRNTPPATSRKLSRDTVYLVGDLLPLCDFASVLAAAYVATLLYAQWFASATVDAALFDAVGRAGLAAAVLAPLILCDRSFVSFASGGQTAALVRCYAVRFALFAGVVVAIGLGGRFLQGLPATWLGLWLAATLLVTVLTRALLVGGLRRLERRGVLTETVAVVGAGPVADRLIRHLMQTRRDSVEIVGVFDDRCGRDGDCVHKPAGSVADLIELGKARSLDWILLTRPDHTDDPLRSRLHRLKALSVAVGLCPQNVGMAAVASAPGTSLVRNDGSLPALAFDPSLRAAIDTVVPRWIFTLLGLPLVAMSAMAAGVRHGVSRLQRPRQRPAKLVFALDDYDLDGFASVASAFGQRRYGFVVTPNADHLIRLHREPSFRALYADAAYVLLDSRFIAHLLRFTQKLHLPVCTGSDLTERLFANVIKPDDPLVLIGGSAQQAAKLMARYGLTRLSHFNPPMGFSRDSEALEACLRFIENHSPFRYCLLAVGAPQQEMVAQQLKLRGRARGMALCIGASINFLTGEEQRAPLWMQRSGLEWLFRLLQAPRRMASRYLVRGPQLFGLLQRTEIMLRPAALPPPETTISLPTPAPPIMARSARRLTVPATARLEVPQRAANTNAPPPGA